MDGRFLVWHTRSMQRTTQDIFLFLYSTRTVPSQPLVRMNCRNVVQEYHILAHNGNEKLATEQPYPIDCTALPTDINVEIHTYCTQKNKEHARRCGKQTSKQGDDVMKKHTV